MFTESDLKELVLFRSEQSPLLSLYLNVDSTQQTTDQYRLTLRSLLRGVVDQAEQADVHAVERYFDFEHPWQGKGVAAFSCQAAEFWRVYTLAVPVQNQAYVSHRPYIKPLTDVLDAYGRYGVILVDREGARMFLFSLGELIEATGTFGEEVRRVKHGGASGVTGMRGGRAARIARREEAVIHRNLKEVAEVSEAFCSAHGCTRLILAGSESNLAQFRDMLPRALHDRVIGSLTIDIGASVAEVQAKSMDLIEETAAKRETKLVAEMIAGWKRGAGAVAGLSDTLAALQEHRAWLLLVAAGFEASGFRCQNCRYLMLTEHDECPLCGGQVEAVEDMVDSVVHRALEQGIEVEIVRGSLPLEEAGSIGALLRY
jgi:peptide subunit release factor 1 (eRF1)